MYRPIVKYFLAKVRSLRHKSVSARELVSVERNPVRLARNSDHRGFMRLNDDQFRLARDKDSPGGQEQKTRELSNTV